MPAPKKKKEITTCRMPEERLISMSYRRQIFKLRRYFATFENWRNVSSNDSQRADGAKTWH